MDRRSFLPLSLLAATASLLTGARSATGTRGAKGFKVEAGKDRFDEELNIMGGQFHLMVSAKDTEGDLCIYHTVRQEKGGPALHVHHAQDEWFYPMSGEFIMQVGDDLFTLKPGDSAFAPRAVPHAFAKTSEGEAQMLILFQPAGSMEEFFQQMARLGPGIPADQERVLKELWVTHGMELVGPPLKY
ncbi:MAG: cupin domain-containing protein [Flavobacteriales bacterium]